MHGLIARRRACARRSLVLSIALWPYGLASGTGHFYMLVWLSYEISTPFLQLRWMIQEVCGKGVLYILNGAALTLSFVGARNLTTPAVVFSLYFTCLRHRTPTVWVYGVASLVPPLLNLFWGKQLVLGIVKLFSKKKAAPSSAKKQT